MVREVDEIRRFDGAGNPSQITVEIENNEVEHTFPREILHDCMKELLTTVQVHSRPCAVSSSANDVKNTSVNGKASPSKSATKKKNKGKNKKSGAASSSTSSQPQPEEEPSQSDEDVVVDAESRVLSVRVNEVSTSFIFDTILAMSGEDNTYVHKRSSPDHENIEVAWSMFGLKALRLPVAVAVDGTEYE